MDRYGMRALDEGPHEHDEDGNHKPEPTTFEEMACVFKFRDDTDTDREDDTDEDTEEEEGRQLRKGGKGRKRRGRGGNVRFDLTGMENTDGQYFQDGVGFNFCEYLPNSQYFASYSSLDGSGL